MLKGPLDRRVGGVAEVRLGATSKEGGTRGWGVVIGGARHMPLHLFEGRAPPPQLAPVVVEGEFRPPRPLRAALGEFVGDPVAWASFAVEELGAKLIFVHFSGPLRGDVERSLKTLRRLLDEVRAPLIIGGPGDVERPHLDAEFLSRAAEEASGERAALSYATLDQYSEVARAAREHGHAIVAYSPTDVNLAKQLNSNLLEAGLSKGDIIMDPTTAPLGWSFEYSYSTFERIRLLALQGDELLQMPLMAAACNAWAARESYAKRPELGPVEQRGVLWEAVTALSYVAAGADLVLVLHPEAYRLVSSVVDELWSGAGARLSFEQLFEGG
ncbi:MAG: hypothetical protein QXT74_03750 [Candidatus Nezhaarchaeales archaeon]